MASSSRPARPGARRARRFIWTSIRTPIRPGLADRSNWSIAAAGCRASIPASAVSASAGRSNPPSPRGARASERKLPAVPGSEPGIAPWKREPRSCAQRMSSAFVACLREARANWRRSDLAYPPPAGPLTPAPLPTGEGLRQSPHAGDLSAAARGDALARLGERLGHRLHVPAVGVKQGERIAQDSDMALPKHEIAALERRVGIVDGDRLAEGRLHHVAVARRSDAGGGQRGLNEARAVDPLRRPAAPEIGRLEEKLGNRDRVARAYARIREMPRPQMQAVRRDREIALAGHDPEFSAERERHARDELDRGARIGVGAQSRDPMG